MRAHPLAALLLLLGAIVTRGMAPAIHARQNAGATLAITGVTVIDVEASDPLTARRRGQTVIIDRGTITHVGPSAKVTVPAGAQRVDGVRGYLIPGLWDAHVHLSNAGPSALPVYVANGITTVRDLGGRISDAELWEKELGRGTVIGPRILKSGPNIEGAWWLDAVMKLLASDPAFRRFPMLEFSPRERLDGPQDASRIVASLAARGVNVIKVRNLRPGEFRAVAAEATQRNLPLVGHMPRGMSIGEAAEQGLRSLEHAETVTLALAGADDAERREEFTRVASSGAAITPTLVSDIAYRQTSDDRARAVINDTTNRIDSRRRYVGRQLLDAWTFGLETKRLDPPMDWAESHRRQVADMRRAHQAGVRLLAGTDLGVPLIYPGFSVHEELELLGREVQVSPLESLRAAAVNPARNMGVADAVAGIAVGQRADLVLLDADPLENIRNTSRIRAVVLNGRYLSRGKLDELLATAERIARASPNIR